MLNKLPSARTVYPFTVTLLISIADVIVELNDKRSNWLSSVELEIVHWFIVKVANDGVFMAISV